MQTPIRNPTGRDATPHVPRELRARHRPSRLLLASVGAIALLAGTPSRAAGPEYAVPLRSEAELIVAARETCEAAREADKPMLVEFTAEWCTDCRAVERLKAQSSRLREALARTESLAVNVGRFDRHGAMLQSFGVRAIAYWVVLDPPRCDTPLQSWTRVAARTLEPVSGAPVRDEELADWIDRQVEKAAEPAS